MYVLLFVEENCIDAYAPEIETVAKITFLHSDIVIEDIFIFGTIYSQPSNSFHMYTTS